MTGGNWLASLRILSEARMAGYQKPGPVGSTQDGFDLGTLARTQSPIPGPVCSLRFADIIAEAAVQGAHTSSLAKHTKPRHHKHHHHHALLKPSAKVMAAFNLELGTSINFDKLADFEGGQQLHGYIPGHTPGVKDDADKVA